MRRRSSGVGLIAVVAASALLAATTPTSGARFSDQESQSATFGSAACFSADTVAPWASASVGSKVTQYLSGSVRQGGTYQVYADVTDSGGTCPPSGVATVRANMSAITIGQTNVNLVAGTYAVGGVTYSHRSASLTANGTLAAGAYSYSLTATDVVANSAAQTGFPITVDNTRPTGTGLQIVNGGATVGKPELGDVLTYTFSERIDPQTVLAGWTGTATNVVVRMTNNTGDRLAVRDATNTTQLPLGSVNLIGSNYVTTTRDFGATGTPSTMVQSGSTITIVMGTASGATGTQATTSNMTWAPTTTMTDAAGNTCQVTTVTETGMTDIDF